MHVDVRITPTNQCPVGTEVIYPLVGQRLLWTVVDAHPDGLAARSDDSDDILILPAKFPVPVVVAKQHHARNPYQNQAYATGSTSFNSTSSFGGGFYNGTTSNA